MDRIFTFKQLRPDAKMIHVIRISFGGGHTIKYNPPTFEGDWDLWLDDTFFVKSICDGGGYVEVVYPPKKRKRKDIIEEIYPICPKCGADIDSNSTTREEYFKEGCCYQHKCIKGCKDEKETA